MVSVIIPTHNRREKLLRLLRDLERQDVPVRHEVIVVDDGSADGTKEAVCALQPRYALKYYQQECRGPAAARNVGIRLAEGEFIILLDDDMRVAPDLVRKHLETHARFDDAIVLGQALLPPDLPDTPFVQYRRRLDRTFVPIVGNDGLARVQGISSGNLSARRAFLERIGFYCEDLFLPGSEEAELSWRLRRIDVPIIYNAAIHACQDDSPVTFGAYCSKSERYATADAEVLAKYPAVTRNLAPSRSLARINGPITWQEDPPLLIGCKMLKTLLSCGPGLALLKAVVAILERHTSSPWLLSALYRLVIGLHIFRGFRMGLIRFRISKANFSALSRASS